MSDNSFSRSLEMATHDADGNSLSPSRVESPKPADVQEKTHRGSSSSGSKVSSTGDTDCLFDGD